MSDTDSIKDEKIVYNPYNFKNKLVTVQDIENILKRNGVTYPIKNLSFYQEAFVHKSYLKGMIEQDNPDKEIIVYSENELKDQKLVDLQPKSQERLEYLGDSVAGLIVAKYLYTRFPKQDEGFLTKIKTRLVCSSTFADFARFVKLYPFLIMSRHAEEVVNGRVNPKILEDTFEAFIGAIYNDLGYKSTEIFLINIIHKKIDFAQLIMEDNNYKDQLMRWFQHNHNGYTPKYYEVSRTGKSTNRLFTMGVLDQDKETVGVGTDKTKKEAEKIAAHRALIELGVLNN